MGPLGCPMGRLGPLGPWDHGGLWANGPMGPWALWAVWDQWAQWPQRAQWALAGCMTGNHFCCKCTYTYTLGRNYACTNHLFVFLPEAPDVINKRNFAFRVFANAKRKLVFFRNSMLPNTLAALQSWADIFHGCLELWNQ